VDDVLKIGQKIQVELKEIDPRGKLSLGAVLAEENVVPAGAAPVSDEVNAAQGSTEPADA
jgi:polyribonucleotide nucleotidyltransferase